MRIAIDTINDNLNYGNRLQNYALQQVLINLGYDVVTIKNYSKISISMPILRRIEKKIRERTLLLSIWNRLNGEKYRRQEQDKLKRERFNEFNRKYIRESDFILDLNTTDFSFDNKFDCYVIGSDQVWNYDFGRFSKLDFISYSDKPKISYAASFGVSTIPQRLQPMYKEGLDALSYISVRESVGQRLVKSLSGRDSELVLDPTLLLKREEWQNLIDEEEKFSERYVLTYFLDEPNREDKLYIHDLAKHRGLKIKSLANRRDQEMWVQNPIDFVNLFSQADVVVTDSFHACVFSIIFQKDFEVFERNYNGISMSSRIDTLLSTFDLGNQLHNSLGEKYPIDYGTVQKKLDELRLQSIDFLIRSLDKVNNLRK